MDTLTPAQQEALRTWAQKRDSLVREIASLTTERDSVKKEADAEASRLTDLRLQEAEIRGSIAVLKEYEDRVKDSRSVEVVDLVTRKSDLESDIVELEMKVASAKREYATVVLATADLRDSNETAKENQKTVTSLLHEMKSTNLSHLIQARSTVESMRDIHNEVIKRADENLAQTSIVLEKLPKYIFELQRPLPVRRHYPIGHPHAYKGEIAPDSLPTAKGLKDS